MSMSPEIKEGLTAGALIAIIASLTAVALSVWAGGIRAGEAIQTACMAEKLAVEANNRSHANFADMREIKANQRNIQALLIEIRNEVKR